MKRVTILGIMSLSLCSFVLAEENVTSEYYEEVIPQEEIIYGISDTESILEINHESAIVEEKIISVENNSTVTTAVESKQNSELSPYLQALEQAKDEDKTIMLSIRSTDCKYCDKMEATTLIDSSVKDALNSDFVTVHYNQDLEPLPLGLQEGATPMFIFVNTNEDILNMYPGMRDPDEFKEALEQILSM